MCLYILLFFLVGTQTSQAQPGFGQVWEKHEQNPVIDLIGDADTWNDDHIAYFYLLGHVIFDGDVYRYYGGGFDGSSWGIGLWTSSNLATGWSEYEDNPVMTEGADNSWNVDGIGCSAVIVDGDTLRMWYAGLDQHNFDAIGYATSTDGVNWTEYEDNPVLERSGEWDSWGIYAPYVIKNGDTFEMWYSGVTINSPWAHQIGYASSEDGINWTVSEENPILEPGPGYSWDGARVGSPVVLHTNDQYLMWFTGSNPNLGLHIGFANSDDGISWQKDPDNPILANGEYNQWDSRKAVPSAVFQDDTTWQMCYIGGNLSDIHGLGLATLRGCPVEDDVSHSPTAFVLYQSYPNPFNATTTIRYGLPYPGNVSLQVYNTLGQQITTLFQGYRQAGFHSATLSADDLASGLYFVRLEASGKVATQKVMLIR